MPVTEPTILFSHTACVSVHVFGEQMPNPHSEIVSSQTAVSLLDTSPAGTIKQPIARPAMMNHRRTRFSSRPRLTSQSLNKPAAMMMADIGRYGTELYTAISSGENPRSSERYPGNQVMKTNQT